MSLSGVLDKSDISLKIDLTWLTEHIAQVHAHMIAEEHTGNC